VRLGTVLDDVNVIRRRGGEAASDVENLEVQGLAMDSRRVRPGDLFFALGGQKSRGDAHVSDALARGATAVVTAPETAAAVPASVPCIEVAEPRLALAQAAARWFKHPARALKVIAVTGTNGKSTTTFLVDAILRTAGMRSGVIGTTGYRIDDEQRPAAFTTPEALELQGLLREMADRGLQAVALEVSSHALVQHRSHGLEFDVAVFTNLTHDHLDFHGTLEAYRDAKLMLFDGRNTPRSTKPATAVINHDDPAGPDVRAAAVSAGLAVIGYGTRHAEIEIEAVTPGPKGLKLQLAYRGVEHAIDLPLLGSYNAWNAAAAFGSALALGITADVAVRGLAMARGVPGRLERVDQAQSFTVAVDYAHTPDALERSLAAIREHGARRVLLVFGCGGDRDRAKRPVMGAIAARDADLAWVTNDNPRSEDPAAIAEQVRAGDPQGRLRVELDRRRAIAAAIEAAAPGDAVLIAGKGHETTQTIGDQVEAFDDREVARELLGARRGAAS
jgi:UDP-N-acetylmuramoyl-L-alanyl-D-glutamate--2,6-diaminopimelate ligase